MRREEAIAVLQKIKPTPCRGDGKSTTHALEIIAIDTAIKALEQEPCGKDINVIATDAISRQAVLDMMHDMMQMRMSGKEVCEAVCELPPVQPKTGHCKDCKYFEYDSAVKVDGAPLIVAHEICSRWGNGCKTREDGCCFLFEPQESEDKE